MYVDTIGGGGNGSLPEGVYFKPNQDLEYAERISDSGMVRTSAEFRTDAPMPPVITSMPRQMTSFMVVLMQVMTGSWNCRRFLCHYSGSKYCPQWRSN